MKIKLAVAFVLILFASIAHADEIVQVNWTDTVWQPYGISPGNEYLSGSLDWDETTGTIYNVSTASTGPLLTTESFSDSSTGFSWVLTGNWGTDTVSEFINSGNLWGDWISGTEYYVNDPDETITILSVTTVPDPPAGVPESSSLLLLGVGLIALLALWWYSGMAKTPLCWVLGCESGGDNFCRHCGRGMNDFLRGIRILP